jgi:UDP-glucose 6-dehydrogenase
MKIGFIGQGWIGKNYADNYEERGYEVVRYSLEEKFIHNKDKVGLCDIVIIAVPTPTTTSGFDYSIVEEGIKLCSDQSLIVVKSTMLPGTTLKLQEKFPGKTVFCSPEFLSERTAALAGPSATHARPGGAHPPFASLVNISAKRDAEEGEVIDETETLAVIDAALRLVPEGPAVLRVVNPPTLDPA